MVDCESSICPGILRSPSLIAESVAFDNLDLISHRLSRMRAPWTKALNSEKVKPICKINLSVDYSPN